VALNLSCTLLSPAATLPTVAAVFESCGTFRPGRAGIPVPRIATEGLIHDHSTVWQPYSLRGFGL
jgi:hypothetical protein